MRVFSPRDCAAIVVGLTLALSVPLAARTAIKPARNRYTPEQDARLGREAADEVRRQYPVIDDARVASYLATLGSRLVAAAPPDLNDPAYEYSFTALDVEEINAFAFPGGPMFVDRGLFDAADSEAEVAGVMAHELAHVLLRHVTASATQAGQLSLAPGQLAATLGSVPLTFSRECEVEADLMGAQVMARAGYDPRALAHIFAAIAREAAARGDDVPEWASSHPSVGRRTRSLMKQAGSLTVAAAAETGQFAAIKALFASLPVMTRGTI